MIAVAAVGSAMAVGPSAAAPSSQAPSSSHESSPEDVVDQSAEAGVPMPVAPGALGYLATRSSTKWMNDRGADRIIANLPVPPNYSKANQAMADSLKREMTAAVETPGACLQIIVDGPRQPGDLFNYGFFAVEKQYCPN